MKIALKGLVEEDFINYKKPSMFLIFPYCSFKCDKECGRDICQNHALAQQQITYIEASNIFDRYKNNPISNSIVFGGLEPFDSMQSLKCLVQGFRNITNDDIVIYTGYKEDELTDELKWLRQYKNIIIKFGRFIPDKESHYDEILGVNLSSPNQYGKYIGGYNENI